MQVSGNRKELFRLIRQAGIYTSIPLVLVAGPVLGYFVGRLIDRWFASDPWGVLVCVLVGLAASVVETVRLIKSADR